MYILMSINTIGITYALQYSALLRLPREFSFKEKLAKVEDIIDTLHLQDCANTSKYKQCTWSYLFSCNNNDVDMFQVFWY